MADNRQLKKELQELASRYDKWDVQTATALRRAADELEIPSTEVVGPTKEQLFNGFKEMIRNQPDGEYYISDILMVNLSSERTRLLNWLLQQLVYNYPNYVWRQDMSLDPNMSGVLISWRRKYKYVQEEKTDESGPKRLGQ